MTSEHHSGTLLMAGAAGYAGICLASLPLKIAQRFNAGAKRMLERSPFRDERTVAISWRFCRPWKGLGSHSYDFPSVETLGYFQEARTLNSYLRYRRTCASVPNSYGMKAEIDSG